jgi:hypothetical protein
MRPGFFTSVRYAKRSFANLLEFHTNSWDREIATNPALHRSKWAEKQEPQ